jgi:hypothetical protein
MLLGSGSLTLESEQLEFALSPACCNGHGYCVAGQCQCDSLWTGKSCEVPQCPNNCSGFGYCVSFPPSEVNIFGSAKCACLNGWGGVDCSVPVCTESCNGTPISVFFIIDQDFVQ